MPKKPAAKTKKPRAKKKKLTVAAALDAALSTGPKSRSNAVVVTPADLDAEAVLAEWIRAEQDEKDARVRKDAAGDQLISIAEPVRLRESRAAADVRSTVRVTDGTVGVSITTKDAYSAVYDDHAKHIEAALADALGDDLPAVMREELALTVRPAAAANDALIGRLVEALGDDFPKVFAVRRAWRPNAEYHRRRCLDEAFAATHQELVVAGLVKPHKPAIKLA